MARVYFLAIQCLSIDCGPKSHCTFKSLRALVVVISAIISPIYKMLGLFLESSK